MVVCEDDAEKITVMKGIDLAQKEQHSTAVTDDTDILGIILQMWVPFMSDIELRHEARKYIKKDLDLIGIKDTVSKIPLYIR